MGTLRLKLEPLPADDAPSDTVPLSVATMETEPVELAPRVVAEVSETLIPPEPAFKVRVGVVSVDVVMEPFPLVLAVREIELDAERGPLRVMFPPVELRLTFGAESPVNPLSVIEFSEVTFTVPEAPVPFIVPPRLTPEFVEVRLIVFAEIVPIFESELLD